MNVRTYKYAHIQKNEIQRLVNERLQLGIIRPSNSSFFSPVLLAKKDGGWQFCVDYRSLNRVTVSDKFPIPFIEEILDELHRSLIYSTIDLKSGYHQLKMDEYDVPKKHFGPMKDITNF